MDIAAFLSADKSMVLAPAGYGKTYTIAEVLAAYQGSKKILVLTHTHAGIASLKEKFDQKHIPSSLYVLDTICSFALNLTKTYHVTKEEIPSESDVNDLFKFSIEHATTILKASPIKHLMKSQYDHLIVDEYQDCSVSQHQMILELASSIKTHLLGDPLQGIFGFRDESIVDFDDESFNPFKANFQSLDTPWRWINAGNALLGKELASIRERLLAGLDIDLSNYSAVDVIIGNKNDYTIPGSAYKRTIFSELINDAVLIHPNNTSINPRMSFVKQFNQLQIIESIDDRDYYKWCHMFDQHSGMQLIKDVADLLREVGSKTVVNSLLKEDGSFKKKHKQEDKAIIQSLVPYTNSLINNKSYKFIAQLIEQIKTLLNVTIYRKDFYRDICQILFEADMLGLTSSEALLRNRNLLRRKGRKIIKKSIGTTLLTKGLEFDHVVVLNAQEFKDPRHLYVALTRSCKRLVVITNNPILHPYSNN